MNFVSLLQQGLIGFLVSLAVLELLRLILMRRWPQQMEGLQLERRLLPWLLALVAGPALFWDATGAYRRREAGTTGDLVTIGLILAMWSLSYGMTIRFLVEL